MYTIPHFKADLFQVLHFPSPEEVGIKDQIYSKHTITDPVLVGPLRSPALTRLAGVHQTGISGLLKLSPKVMRLKHSVGAFLLPHLCVDRLDYGLRGAVGSAGRAACRGFPACCAWSG